MKLFSNRFLFIVWLVDSAIFAWLFIYIVLHGSTPERTQWMSALGAVWGGTAAFLIGPFWKAMKLWPERRRTFFLSALLIIVLVAGGWFWVRARQTAKLETLFKEDQEVERDAAPKKQRFMQLTRENPQTLDAYLQRCAELEP